MRAALGALRQHLLFWKEDSLTRAILTGIFTVSALTAVVKVVAFGKELAVANYFGVSHVMDAFTSAFVIWTFLIGVIGGAMPDALVPVYSKALRTGKTPADTLAVHSIWIYFGQLALVTVVTLLLGEWLVPFFTSEYSPEKQAQTLLFFRCLAPFSIFWGMSLLLTMLLQANKQFVLGALAPVVVPASGVLSLLLGYNTMGIYALLWGTVIGAGLQLSLLFNGYFRRYCSVPLFTRGKIWSPEMREVLNTATPYLLSGLIMGSAILVDMGMAAWLDSGSVSVLAYGHRVCAIALTLVSTAVAEAFFPYMADLVAGNEWRRLRRTVMQFSALILVCSIPVIGVIWWSSEWLVGLLFERGEFTHADTLRVAGVVCWLSLQIPFYILAVLGSRVVCAMLASKFILLTTVVNLGVNIGCNILFLKIMGINGIALSTSLVYLFSFIMLYTYLLHQVEKRIHSAENP